MKAWFSAAELAGKAGMPSRSNEIPRLAEKEGWKSRPRVGRGGGLEWSIDSFAPQTQTALAPALLEQSTQACPSSPSGDMAKAARASALSAGAELATLAAIYEGKSQREKDEASARLGIVTGYHHLRTSGVGRAAALETVSGARQVSIATITRYLARVEGKPEHAWLYLLTPRYCGRTTTSDISAEAWEILQADFLRRERPAPRACITRLREAAQGKDWTLPSDRTLERRLARLPRAVQILAREGARALSESYPAQQRSKAALVALQIVNADGYKHNLWVRFPDGEVIRAKTWYWQDVYSSKILAWRTDKTEHTDMVRLAFGDLVERWGIPEAVLLDNTLAAANKTMSGGIRHRFRFKVREEEPDGVYKNLNVDVMWATPRHGQAKPIERAFGIGGVGEYVDKAPDFAGAWTGANTLDKPDYDGKTRAIELAELGTVMEREIAAWNARGGRRGAMTYGRSIDAVFEESYKVVPIRRATEEQRRLWLLATEPVRASAKDGSITLDAGRIVGERLSNRYWSAALFEHAGKMVAARFDPQRLHAGVHIYTADGRYICFADCDRPAGFNDQLAARERARARNTFTRSVKIARAATVRMDTLEAAKALAGSAPPTIPAATPARSVVRGEFRDPLERPRADARPLTTEESADVLRLEAEMAAPASPRVYELRDDHQRHTYWLALRSRIDAGEQLAAEDQAFHQSWQQDPYFRFINEEAERKAG